MTRFLDLEGVLARAGARDETELHQSYRQAIAQGGRYAPTRELERISSSLQLLCRTVTHLPGLGLYPALLDAGLTDARLDADRAGPMIGAISAQAAAALRLTHRALEAHARDVGYRPDAWVEQTVCVAEVELACAHPAQSDDESGLFGEQVVAATGHLAQALAASQTDRMAVPDRLSQALAHLLVIYVLVRELATAQP
jgi:hypothetical protein